MSGAESKFLDLSRHWFNVKLPLKQCSLKELATFTISKEGLDEVYQEAQSLFDDEVSRRQNALNRSSWYSQQFDKRGTVADRIASSAVNLTGEELMFHLESFDFLFETARNDSHHFEAALKALGAIWPKILPARPLKKFGAQYFATLPPNDAENSAARGKVLIYWYLEDTLKRMYGQFLTVATTSLKDKLAARREAWLETIGKLLVAVAESRSVAVSLIVEKLGDPMSKIAHRAYHILLGMLSETSTNQSLLLSEVEKVLFQKNCPLGVQKYCVNVINQLVFNKDEKKLALKSVQTYLALFKQLAVAGAIDHSITDAIIVGLRRSFPFTGTDFSLLDPHIDPLFVIANTGVNFLQRVSSLTLVYQLISKGYTKLEDRFYRVLYQLLLTSPKSLPHSSQLTGFFALLYKALRADKSTDRVVAFVHRLLQRCLFAQEAFVCASLLLIAELVNCHHQVKILLRPARGNASAGTTNKKPAEKDSGVYDPKAREPQFCHPSTQCLWIIGMLARHSHPSVVKLAILLREGADISFDSHPLDDLTLTNFLEMFVDAKTEDQFADSEGNQLAAASNSKGVSIFKRAVHVANIPRVSDPTFAEANPADLDVSTLFLHRFAVQRVRFMDERYNRSAKAPASAAEGEEPTAERLADSAAAFLGPGSKKATKPKKSEKDTSKFEIVDDDVADDDEGIDPEAFDHDFDEDVGDDDSFDWGDGSDGYGDSDEDEDEEAFAHATRNVGRLTGKRRQRNEDGEEEGSGEYISKSKKPATDANEFDSIMKEAHQQAPTKKQRLEEKWLDRATSGKRKGR
jgi:ribosome biogenesis protein MAK21